MEKHEKDILVEKLKNWRKQPLSGYLLRSYAKSVMGVSMMKVNPFGLYVDPDKFNEYSQVCVWGRKLTKDGIGPWVKMYQFEIGEKLPEDSPFVDLYLSLETD